MDKEWQTYNPTGALRVIVTKQPVGTRWLEILTDAGCRVEVCVSTESLSSHEIVEAMSQRCHGAIGQLNETWDREVLTKFKSVGGRVYSNVAVGYNNVDLEAATSLGIPVGNTPGVLTVTTAELTVALTFAVARRIAVADKYVREGRFKKWESTLFLGEVLRRKTVGVIGAGRIGTAYGKMMVEGHRMNLIYFNRHRNESLEDSVQVFNKYLETIGEKPVQCKWAQNVEEVLRNADIVSLHPSLNETTHHLIDAARLELMKKDAILINVSRGPVIDEQALVDHCRKNPEFRVGLDVYEKEPELAAGLKDLPNAVLLPHIGSATYWTREAMATIAARNVAAILSGFPTWKREDMNLFLENNAPKAAPSIVNRKDLGL